MDVDHVKVHRTKEMQQMSLVDNKGIIDGLLRGEMKRIGPKAGMLICR